MVFSSSEAFRKKASVPDDISDGWYYDTVYEGEIVRAKIMDGRFVLHKGGGAYIDLGEAIINDKKRLNPGRDNRFLWMQSAIRATHYIVGRSEQDYLNNIPDDVILVPRDEISDPSFAYIP